MQFNKLVIEHKLKSYDTFRSLYTLEFHKYEIA